MRHRRKQRSNRSEIPSVILFVVVFYMFLALFTYRFRHPKETETELLMHFPEAMMWK